MLNHKLSIGIVGLPNAGKSTLFNALLKKQLAKVAPYPFTTIEPHEGVIDVPDVRLTNLTLMVKPDKSTPSAITFIDIAGLVKNAHKGEGLGNEFLGHIREVSAILQVVRAFESSDAPHTLTTVDPDRDMEIINTELLLKDLDTISKKVAGEKEADKKALFEKAKESLNKELPINKLRLNSEEDLLIKDLQLLTSKPMFYVLNISEKELETKKLKALEEKDFLIVCAKLEADLIALSPAEQAEYLISLGVTSSGLDKVIKEAYSILNLITFYTIKGGKEVRAWPIPKETAVLTAAGMVHTDFAKHFIKAEVISYPEFIKYTSWSAAKEAGKIDLVGHDYLVKDGDIIEFKVGV
jgi:hypothetical protein